MSVCLGTLGEAYMYLDNYEKAKMGIKGAIEIARKIESNWLLSNWLFLQG